MSSSCLGRLLVVVYVLVSTIALLSTYRGGKKEKPCCSDTTDLQEEHWKDPGEMVLVTTASSEDMEALRELIGSLHHLRHSHLDMHLIIVYGFGLTLRNRREISLWRNVEVVDGDEVFYMGQHHDGPPGSAPSSGAKSIFSAMTLLQIMELTLQKHHQVLYTRCDYAFTVDSIHHISALIDKDGFFIATKNHTPLASTPQDTSSALFDPSTSVAMGFNAHTKQANLFVSFVLQCMRGYHCDPWLHQQLVSEQNAELSSRGHFAFTFGLVKMELPRYYCYLLLRDDILYYTEHLPTIDDHGDQDMESWDDWSTAYESPLAAFPLPNSGKIPIAIGMPTLSVVNLTSFEGVSPLTIFIPSLLKTVTPEEWLRFEYWIYIGFDEGDRYFDVPQERQKINEKVNQMVKEYREAACLLEVTMTIHVEYVRFPYSRGWVTFIWNGLFVRAMRDGAHYFYQVNDDLELKNAGWSTFFVDSLTANDQYGVAGPWDDRQNGLFLTQALVSRKHYFIFGKLYPLDIKDWHSDNWLNEVYSPENRYSVKSISADNKNDQGTRYSICELQPNYPALLKAGKRLIQDWKADVRAILQLSQNSSQSGQHLDRLKLELSNGPVF